MSTDKLDFTDLIQSKTKGFTGREWLVQDVKQFLVAGQGRYYLLCGEPGIGKTCFAAHLVASEGYLHHFISADDLDWRSPLAFARSLAAQLAQRYGGWVLSEDPPPPNFVIDIEVGSVEAGGSVTGVSIGEFVGLSVEEEFRRLALRSLKRLSQAGQGPVVLVVDGLDEAAAYSGKPTILDLIDRLGTAPCARLLITANPGPVIDELLDDLQLLSPGAQLKRDLDGLDPHNQEDCRRFMEAAIQMPEIADRLQRSGIQPEQFVTHALEHSEGNFLYLSYLLDALKKGVQINLSDLPDGLEKVYRVLLSQVVRPSDPSWIDVYIPVLGTLAVMPKPVTKAELVRLAGRTDRKIQKALNGLRPFLEFDSAAPLNERTYRLYHQAFARFLLDPQRAGDYWIDPQEVHRRIADRLRPRIRGVSPVAIQDPYSLNFLAYHLRQAGAGHRQELMKMITPEMHQLVRKLTGSNLAFHLNLGEAIAAALDAPMPERLVEVARLGLIDASLGSRVASLPPGLLAELARSGAWERATALAHSSSDGAAAGLEAVVTGMLAAPAETSVDAALTLAREISPEGEPAYHRARALARVGQALAAAGDAGAIGVFEAAGQAAQRVPELDQQARALAFLAGRAAGLWEEAPGVFTQALDLALSMPTELESDTREAVMTANMVAQTAMEAEWNLQRTPFDTQGAKARALADVAAELQAAGLEAQAGQAFFAAEELAHKMTGRPIDEVYRQHTQGYLTDRRTGPPQDELPALRPLPELEAALLAHERLPEDRKGFYARILVTAVRLLAAAGDARAGELLERAVTRLNAVEGGYRAQILLEMARLERRLGREALADDLEQQAETIAREDPGLLGGYQK